MSRPGKIASLPEAVREQLNLRLADGQSAPAILPWLNQLPEVLPLLQQRFHGQPLKKNNLSAWRRHGYPQWLDDHRHLEQLQQLSRQSSAFSVATGPTPSEGGLALAALRLFEALQGCDVAHEPARFVLLTQGLVGIRNAESNARRARVEEAKLAQRDREIAFQERRLALLEATHRNLLPAAGPGEPSRGLTPETLSRIEEATKLL